MCGTFIYERSFMNKYLQNTLNKQIKYVWKILKYLRSLCVSIKVI